MLIDHFFRITEQKREGESWVVGLTLNAGHPIFDGHFPGNPVVPGVCLIQMVMEVTKIVLSSAGVLRLVSASQIKFISFIDPRRGDALVMRLTVRREDRETDRIRVEAAVFTADTRAFTLSGVFRCSPPCC
jgi:3-hydroxyacyl-[acyl-carrier-protein] dehydratase